MLVPTIMSKKKQGGLAGRMKSYEEVSRRYLLPNMNNIIRLDGRAFHTYTMGLDVPFDMDFIKAMDEVAAYLCAKIDGAKFAYVQSDEISICFTDYDTTETIGWFDGCADKIVSVAAAMCTARFNQIRFLQRLEKVKTLPAYDVISNQRLAEFDARVFQLPNKDEVVNNILWRQRDCTRNSIQAVAQSMFSQPELEYKNTDVLQDMIFKRSGINWNDYDPKLKRGRFIIKRTFQNEADATRAVWESVEGPILSKDRDFLLNLLPTETIVVQKS